MANIINGINQNSGGSSKDATVVAYQLCSEGNSASASFTVQKAGLFLLEAQFTNGSYSMKVNGTAVTPQKILTLSGRFFNIYYLTAKVGDVLNVNATAASSGSWSQATAVIIQIS